MLSPSIYYIGLFVGLHLTNVDMFLRRFMRKFVSFRLFVLVCVEFSFWIGLMFNIGDTKNVCGFNAHLILTIVDHFGR